MTDPTLIEFPDARAFLTTKDNGQQVWVRVRRASRKELEAADFEQSRVFNQALLNELPPRSRMLRKLRDAGLWGDADEAEATTLRQGIAEANTGIASLTEQIGKISLDAEGKERGPDLLSADEQTQLAALNERLKTATFRRGVLFDSVRQLRIEIDGMLGHTADARAEEAQRNCLICCVSEFVTIQDGKVSKVLGRVWPSIEPMLTESDGGLLQRTIYEYMTFDAGMPSTWEADRAKNTPAPTTEPVPAPTPPEGEGAAPGAAT